MNRLPIPSHTPAPNLLRVGRSAALGTSYILPPNSDWPYSARKSFPLTELLIEPSGTLGNIIPGVSASSVAALLVYAGGGTGGYGACRFIRRSGAVGVTGSSGYNLPGGCDGLLGGGTKIG